MQHATSGSPSLGQQTFRQRPIGSSQQAMAATIRPRPESFSSPQLSGPSRSAPNLHKAELYGNSVVDPYRINNRGGVQQALSGGGRSQFSSGAIQQGFGVFTPQVGPMATPQIRPGQKPLQLGVEHQAYSSSHEEIRPNFPERMARGAELRASAPGLHPFEDQPQMQMQPGLRGAEDFQGLRSDFNLTRQPTSTQHRNESLTARGQQSPTRGLSAGTEEPGRAEGALSVAAMASQQAQRALQSQQRQDAAKWN